MNLIKDIWMFIQIFFLALFLGILITLGAKDPFEDME